MKEKEGSESSSSSMCGQSHVKGDGHLDLAGQEASLDCAAIVSPYAGYGKKQFIELPKMG